MPNEVAVKLWELSRDLLNAWRKQRRVCEFWTTTTIGATQANAVLRKNGLSLTKSDARAAAEECARALQSFERKLLRENLDIRKIAYDQLEHGHEPSTDDLTKVQTALFDIKRLLENPEPKYAQNMKILEQGMSALCEWQDEQEHTNIENGLTPSRWVEEAEKSCALAKELHDFLCQFIDKQMHSGEKFLNRHCSTTIDKQMHSGGNKQGRAQELNEKFLNRHCSTTIDEIYDMFDEELKPELNELGKLVDECSKDGVHNVTKKGAEQLESRVTTLETLITRMAEIKHVIERAESEKWSDLHDDGGDSDSDSDSGHAYHHNDDYGDDNWVPDW